MDTLRPEKQFVIRRFPLYRGYFICTAIYLNPQKQSVIERFPLLGEFVIRGQSLVLQLKLQQDEYNHRVSFQGNDQTARDRTKTHAL